MPHNLAEGEPTRKTDQGGGLSRLNQILQMISAVSARLGAVAGDPRGLQYEQQRKGEARQGLLDKQSAEHRAAMLELAQGRFGLEEKRFEREGLDRLGRLKEPTGGFTGAGGYRYQTFPGGRMAQPEMRAPRPEEITRVAPGTRGPEAPPEMQEAIRREGIHAREYVKPPTPTVDTSLSDLELWVQQNQGRPISEYWKEKAGFEPTRKLSALQEEIRLFTENPELYWVMKGNKPAAFTKDMVNKAQSIAVRIMGQKYALGVSSKDFERYNEEFREEFERALQQLASGGVAPVATPTGKTISLSEIRSRASRLGIGVEQAVENAKAAGYEVTP